MECYKLPLLVENKIQKRNRPGILLKLLKLSNTLTTNRNTDKKVTHVLDSLTETFKKKIKLKKYTQLCTRIGKSKYHISKPIMKETTPHQTKRRKSPTPPSIEGRKRTRKIIW